ncbi:MAG TPA: TldD/PmbA family protein [Firmicutes bacterium]|nr:TldD/PmbA family protein [Candidatus Fermentithermobacillaceae bacterium]
MLGKEKSMWVIQTCLEESPSQEVEVTVMGQDQRLTRFTQNYIHQNVAETDAQVRVRAINGKRIGTASTNGLDRDSLMSALLAADARSRLVPEEPMFPGLCEPRPIPEGPPALYDSTLNCPPDLRAAYVARAVRMAKEKGVSVAGAFSTGSLEVAIGNSKGVRAYYARTDASMTCVAMSPTSTGYAEGGGLDVAAIDPTEIAGTAIAKCLSGQDPVSIPPGEYDVVLEPLAVRDMLMYLSFMGFSGAAYRDGASFISGKMGEKVAGDNITIWDDGLDPSGYPMPFDFEGVPKQKVMLIEEGVAKGVVYDSLTAAREGRESTGHSLGDLAPIPSLPLNLFMAGGEASVADMIASTKKGILVTRFHYVNPVHPTKAIITGMTRDGTFLIENGEIVRGLKNMRFTESVLGAFSRVEALSPQKVMPGLMSIVCPAIKVRGFTFTGTTEF